MIREETWKPSVLILITFVSYAVKYGVNLLLAHHMTDAYYGDYSLAMKFLDFVIILSLFGTYLGSTRFYAKYVESKEEEMAINYIAWDSQMFKITFSLVSLFGLLIFVIMWILHWSGIRHITQYHIIVYMFWVGPFAALARFLGGILVANNFPILQALYASIVRYIVQFILFLLIILFVSPMLSNIEIFFVIVSVFVFEIILALCSLKKDTLQNIYLGIQKARTTHHLSNQLWMTTCRRLALNKAFFSLICLTDITFVRLFSKQSSDVGHYAAALLLCSFLWLITRRAYNSLKHSISLSLQNKSLQKKLQIQLDRVNAIIIPIIILFAGLILYFAHPLLFNFGPRYVAAVPALMILTFGTCLASICHISSVLLAFGGEESILLKVAYLELGMLLILLWPATHFYGITGTAVATVIAMLSKAFVGTFYVRRIFGVRPILIF